eukprot:3073253-Amphidinium_carterae.1
MFVLREKTADETLEILVPLTKKPATTNLHSSVGNWWLLMSRLDKGRVERRDWKIFENTGATWCCISLNGHSQK